VIYATTFCLFGKVRFTVQVNDRSKHLSKQQAADLADKEHNDDIRRSIKRSNLVRQQDFKKMKKNQKRTGRQTSGHFGNIDVDRTRWFVSM
jgi:hypothetical protein